MKQLIILVVLFVIHMPIDSFSETGFCTVRHNVGKIGLARYNDSFIGGNNFGETNGCLPDSHILAGSCLYPKNSLVTYLSYCDAWVGGVVKGDTLVSSYQFWPYFFIPITGVQVEFHPHEYPLSHMLHRSNLDPAAKEFKGAISEQDFIGITTDTVTRGLNIIPDYFHFRPHQPMGLEIESRSFAWSLGYAEDFVLFEWVIRNIGDEHIYDAYVGIEFDVAVGDLFFANELDRLRENDELGGFLSKIESAYACNYLDTSFIMWGADNDGDPVQGEYVVRPTYEPASDEYVVSCPHASAVELISAPVELIAGNTVSYNWWIDYIVPGIDFGPRHSKNFRDFHTGGLGSPWGDVNQYYVMQNGEIDYDPAYTMKIKQSDLTWMYPDQVTAFDIANGTYLIQLLSVGPFDMQPGAEASVVFSFVMGENFHTKTNNAANLPNDPDAYYDNLDFSDLAKNAMTAKWIYDNPGIDTDGDGYKGEFRICVLDSVLELDSNWIPTYAETTYYKGDGIPDWKAALPPPIPKMWVTPMFRGINIRFNGSESENSKDIFTQMNDFEGFKVYLARDDRESSFSLIGTYDIENYDKYVWNYQKQPDPGWDLLEFPMKLRDIRCNYAFNCNDSSFDPLRYRPSQPYVHPNYPESLFYWENHNWNTSEFGVTSNIKRIYPTARDPRKIPADSLTPNDYTADGYLKYFDYEFTIENLLPTVQYFVSVTAFDFGWPASNLEPLETSITDNAQAVFASVIDSVIAQDYKNVVVYPNPYRSDEGYRPRGFEGLGQDERSNERVRRIHFANLPPKCKIMIYSLDGDLVREIHHDKSPNDPTAAHEEWGLISRNGLAVVSGLYYWVVESDDGTVQMGKLAIIL